MPSEEAPLRAHKDDSVVESVTNTNDVPQTPGHQPQPTTPQATTSKMNKNDAMRQFDNILKSLDEADKPDFLNYVQIKLKLEEEEKQRKEFEKRKEHIKHESKEYQEKHEKKLQKCVARYHEYDYRCRRIKSYYPTMEWMSPEKAEKKLQGYRLEEFDAFMKRMRKAESGLLEMETNYFPYEMTFYSGYFSEYFELKWKKIKKNAVTAKTNLSEFWKNRSSKVHN
ncbi:hypothetical protein GCK72_016773 [Caenorhabditis remanei]|uniref:Uncharacterized protein n=1 Tax=Caenorhabditis remanei TaxID=31234 RepID=A0A6A5G5T1_CAERE|nr:hypothetical protein GCK72_016773 [Caenorhabditis remanei]KAF1750226.1 hypothetical protein GCK72_016773 [Caenorhabditis remanei]